MTIRCPHCNLAEPFVWSQVNPTPDIGLYRMCERCGGISIYYERKPTILELRKATKDEFESIRRTPEMLLLRRFWKEYKIE